MNEPIYYRSGELYLDFPKPDMTAHYDWGERPDAISYIVYYNPDEITEAALVDYLHNPTWSDVRGTMPENLDVRPITDLLKTPPSGQTKR